ncbi:uncharacterized protein LACBIDRAFT_299537 [Laccaria bicolor S238N-H82]|uniref:Predicted protein n=1 Tax=Laccaria bicolor (strain S238N-H82 / ATCC MYA-4686) TaxID=486041 RepID=B0E3R5_LACBS|nr:uncharacterized protein LACBIDRAFT_299537 [Laccaria bicolor S238N-H82]EDQ98518.1 predicted protein [Laccaria bicolor S238N-H82]|eukprot:XP_001890833.1 predicted protein [Laccaria bicolor S238N-H82]
MELIQLWARATSEDKEPWSSDCDQRFVQDARTLQRIFLLSPHLRGWWCRVSYRTKAAGGVIPRPIFFPKGPGSSPRLRSFSGFNSETKTKNPEVVPPCPTKVWS